jgi:hypothetical protein
MNMKNIGNKSKMAMAFVSGAIFVALLQVSPLKASTGAPTGSCVGLGNYSAWGWSATNGSNKEYSELGILNFDTNTSSAIINKATVGSSSSPTYSEGNVENSSFSISSGPMAGTFKLMFDDNDYIIIAPANGGNTIFYMDARNGVTGVCQKI